MQSITRATKLAALGVLAALAFGLVQPQGAAAEPGGRDWRDQQRYERHGGDRDRDREHYRDRDRDRDGRHYSQRHDRDRHWDRDRRHWNRPGHGYFFGYVPKPPYYGHDRGNHYAYGHAKCRQVIHHGYHHGRPAKFSRVRCYDKHGRPYWKHGGDHFLGYLGFGIFIR
jgi:hypothetical protein